MGRDERVWNLVVWVGIFCLFGLLIKGAMGQGTIDLGKVEGLKHYPTWGGYVGNSSTAPFGMIRHGDVYCVTLAMRYTGGSEGFRVDTKRIGVARNLPLSPTTQWRSGERRMVRIERRHDLIMATVGTTTIGSATTDIEDATFGWASSVGSDDTQKHILISASYDPAPLATATPTDTVPGTPQPTVAPTIQSASDYIWFLYDDQAHGWRVEVKFYPPREEE